MGDGNVPREAEQHSLTDNMKARYTKKYLRESKDTEFHFTLESGEHVCLSRFESRVFGDDYVYRGRWQEGLFDEFLNERAKVFEEFIESLGCPTSFHPCYTDIPDVLLSEAKEDDNSFKYRYEFEAGDDGRIIPG